MYIQRIQQGFLADWFRSPTRKPLIIRGARQVGKSTLVRHFAATEQVPLAEVNLEEHRTTIRQAFESRTVADILAHCARVSGVDLADRSKTVILFLDEIQTVPSALQSLRYLHEKYPNLAVIAAGSVLELTLASPTFSMPVGRVSYLFVSPITFKEYLRASNREDLAKAIESAIPGQPESLTIDVHKEIMDSLRRFLFVGGMPEVLGSYLQQQAPPASYYDTQNDLLNSYRDDIQKYPASSHTRDVLREIFDRLPVLIGKKVKYSQLAPNETSRDVKKSLALLIDIGLIHEVVHSDSSGAPLAAQEDRNTRKLYYLDIGLLLRQLGLATPQAIALDDDRLVNEGVLAEQFVAQELLARGNGRDRPRLHYWLREKKTSNAEVDFALAHNRHVVPLEVKAGPAGQMKSLWEFCKIRRSKVAIRFDANPPSAFTYVVPQASPTLTVPLLTLPLYMASEFDRVVDGFL